MLFRERLATRRDRGGPSPWLVLVTVLTGLGAAGFSVTILAVSLHTVARDLHASSTLITWTVTGPFLALAIAMPVFGKLGDVAGHRRVYVLGLVGFTIASALTAVAWDGVSLVVLRLVGGVAGAATGPASMAIVMRSFPVNDRVRAMGWWSLVGSGAPVLGLVAGGPIVESIGWRGIFVVQAPLGLVALVAAVFVLHETPRAPSRIDWSGAAALASASVFLLLGLNLGGDLGWGDPIVVVLLAVTPFVFAAFVHIEQRSSEPLVPLDLFRRRTFSASLAAQWCANFAYMGGYIVTPLLVERQFGFSVAAASLAMVCRPLMFSLSAPAAGYVAVKVGERRASVTGMVLLVLSMICFVGASEAHALALVFVGLVLSGLALGASQPSLITEAANTVDDSKLGVANAVQQMAAQIGAVIGIQVLSTIQLGGGGTAGFTSAYAVGAVVAAIGIAGAALVVPAARRGQLRVARAA